VQHPFHEHDPRQDQRDHGLEESEGDLDQAAQDPGERRLHVLRDALRGAVRVDREDQDDGDPGEGDDEPDEVAGAPHARARGVDHLDHAAGAGRGGDGHGGECRRGHPHGEWRGGGWAARRGCGARHRRGFPDRPGGVDVRRGR